ncbi:MAG TPA: hypothetical protein PKX92_08135 [Edaphocola sp.]|nr:hypothetical protein [Edaphocola sp.]
MNIHFEFFAEVFILLMLAVAFIQSGLDKIIDWKGNFDFMKQHFAKSPFKNMVKINLGIVLVMELLSGVLALMGLVFLLVNGNPGVAKLAAILSVLTFGALFTGQRLAKDYAGAQTIVIYLMPTFFLLWLLFAPH